MGDSKTRTFSNLYLEGSIDNLDLRKVTLENIRFGHIEFTRCEVDETTRVVACDFEGKLLVDNSCVGFERLSLQGGTLSPQARSIFQSFEVPGLDRRVTAQHVKDAVTYALKRFQRGEGLKTSKEIGVRGSTKNEYGFGDKIIDGLIKYGVLERFRVSSGYNLRVKEKADVYEFLNNSYLRGRLSSAVKELVDDLAD